VVLAAFRNEDVYKIAAKPRKQIRIAKLQKVQRKQFFGKRSIFKQKIGPLILASTPKIWGNQFQEDRFN